MEKQPQLKKKIFKILPKAAAYSVTFQNLPFSPGRDHQFVHKHKHHGRKGSMIPDEARRKAKGGGRGNRIVESQEPTSPKVSCMGQIKHKKHQQSIKSMSLPKHHMKPLPRSASSTPTEAKKHTSTFRRIFWGGRKSTHALAGDDGSSVAPSLSQMKRFASGRGAFANFDWKAQVVAPEEDDDDEILIPFSEPILVGGRGGGVPLNPRTEINLWKRRTMAPPTPLQLNPLPTPT